MQLPRRMGIQKGTPAYCRNNLYSIKSTYFIGEPICKLNFAVLVYVTTILDNNNRVNIQIWRGRVI